MSPVLGWGLAAAALVLGFALYGWPGVVLAFTVIVFWLLLQFSRVLRTMQQASGRPVGSVPSAVMLHSRLRKGMPVAELLQLTRSLGQRVGDDPETFRWQDAGGDAVRVSLHRGRVDAWTLERAGGSPAAPLS